MAVAAVLVGFRIRVHAVVNQHVGALNQAEDVPVWSAGFMFRIRYIADRPTTKIDAVADGAAGMVESSGREIDSRMRQPRGRRLEVAELDANAELQRGQREVGRAHEALHHFAARRAALEMAHMETGGDALPVKRLHERQADDVIEVAMGEEQVEV